MGRDDIAMYLACSDVLNVPSRFGSAITRRLYFFGMVNLRGARPGHRHSFERNKWGSGLNNLRRRKTTVIRILRPALYAGRRLGLNASLRQEFVARPVGAEQWPDPN